MSSFNDELLSQLELSKPQAVWVTAADGNRVQLWIHGHTHDSFDYFINGTRVVCNPRGYAVDGITENAAFDVDLTVDIERATDSPSAVAAASLTF